MQPALDSFELNESYLPVQGENGVSFWFALAKRSGDSALE